MFLKNSRYFGLPTVESTDRQGRKVQAVKLRRLPSIAGNPYEVEGKDQLDIIAETTYKDATQFWHIADANSELEANELVHTGGREIEVPKS
jgi:hypothetical protein